MTHSLLPCGPEIVRRQLREDSEVDHFVELTKNEYRILQVLMENKGKTVSRDVLMQRLWESDSFVDENTLSVNVARLRKKLDGAGLENFIATKKGMGYIVE